MSVDEKVELNETCDSCGCFAEIGTIIGEGDDVMELVIEAAAEADAREICSLRGAGQTGHCRSQKQQRAEPRPLMA